MKITMIGTLPPLKGISPYCLELVRALSKHVEIEFIGFKSLYPEFLYPGGTKVKDEGYNLPHLKNIEIRNMLTWYNPFSWIFAGLTLKGKVVHAQWWAYPLALMYLVILSIAKLRKRKVIITVHNVLPHEKSRLKNFLNRVVLFFGDYFIVHTESNREDLSRLYGIPRDRIYVIPHGILEVYPVKWVPKIEARKYLGIPEDKRVILHFGNIRNYKGLDVLIESLKLVKEEVNDVVLLIAGKPWESWGKYERLIEKNGVSDIVIKKLDFIPPSEVEFYFAASDVVVLPYKYFDSQSGVAALALTFKKPLIVTNVGGLPDMVRDEKVIAKAGDAKDLAMKIVHVLKDEKILEKLSKDAEELAKNYSWDKIAERTVEVYKEVYKGEDK